MNRRKSYFISLLTWRRHLSYIRWALRRQKVPEKRVNAVMPLYVGSRSRVKTMVGTSHDFDIRKGVHQESALSLLLFITVIKEATKIAQGGAPWELLYADDLVLTSESKEKVTDKFNRWEDEMEQRGLKINMDKTKLMVTGKKAKERIQSGRWPCDAVEGEWEQIQCFVLSVRNGVTIVVQS